jgi:hypothetical protein
MRPVRHFAKFNSYLPKGAAMQLRLGSWWATWFACLGMVLPCSPADAAAPPTAKPQDKPVIADVSLHEAGKLYGIVVDAQGLPMPATNVAISQSGKVVARTKTDALGQFTTSDLRGGLYQIAAGTGVTTLRVWEAKAAPPAARPAALVVGNPNVVRGQRPFGSLAFSDGLVLAAIIAAAIAIPIAVSRSGDAEPSSS